MSPKVLATKNHEFQDYKPLFYKPHTLTSLLLLLALLFIFSQSNYLETVAERFSLTDVSKAAESQQNFKANGANIGVIFAFVCVGAIHLPNTIMTRPHVIVWRIVLALFICYAMFITYLLLLPVDQAREILRIFDD